MDDSTDVLQNIQQEQHHILSQILVTFSLPKPSLSQKTVKYSDDPFSLIQELLEREKELALVNDGYRVDAPTESHAYTFYVQAPGGFTVEIMSE